MKKFLKTFIFAFVIFVLIMVLGYYVFLNSISKGQGTENKDAPADGEPVNILIVGVDAKDTNASEGARTDTIMLATFNPTSKLLDIISIPRDTRVKIAGRKGEDKINHAYAFGGIENAIETVEGFLNVKINYYVKVDYKGLIKLVDDIGGIEIDVPMDMKYNDPYSDPPIKIDLKKGKQVLDSNKALQFVRFRKGYSDQDLGRINAQHAFMAALADKLLSPLTIFRLPKLLETFSSYVETDMPMSAITAYGIKGVSMKKEYISMSTIPGEPKLMNGVWYYIPDMKATNILITEVFNNINRTNGNSNITESRENIKIEVLNGSGIAGLATEVAEVLRNEGYNVVNIANVSGIVYSETYIYDRKKNEKETNKVAKILGVKNIEQDLDEAGNVDVTIIVGRDMKK